MAAMAEELKEDLSKEDLRKEDLSKYYKVLELDPDAPFSEIKGSYLHLKRFYSTQSPVLAAMMDDIPADDNQRILAEVEEAYRKLKDRCLANREEKERNTRNRVERKNIPEFDVFSGNALKLIREVLSVDLSEIALSTGIPARHLKNIEMERFDLLPPGGYLRIYVKKYAEYLSLDAVRVSDDYMALVEKKKGQRGGSGTY